MSGKTKSICLLTFDVEEWFQVENLKGAISRSEWKHKKSTVSQNTHRILELLDKYHIPATFFILGWVAKRQPDLIREIFKQGHEVACHGYGHERANLLKEDHSLEDITRSKHILEDTISESVVGYRAPNFSISDVILEHLKELNFIYDSSYNPFQLNRRYGKIAGKLQQKSDGYYITQNGVYEVPLSSYQFKGIPIPIGGGAYFRIIPFRIFKKLVKSKLQQGSVYNFYLHPWEFEPQQERIKGIKLNYRFRHYYGLNHTAAKLEKLIIHLKELGSQFLTIKNFVQKVEAEDN
ncbi:MAG: polysaccharide deacetylase family protein [Calditrichaeota bacterium]|nr:polysaccharide deacetylase family protein [Calditrichota bacterium]